MRTTLAAFLLAAFVLPTSAEPTPHAPAAPKPKITITPAKPAAPKAEPAKREALPTDDAADTPAGEPHADAAETPHPASFAIGTSSPRSAPESADDAEPTNAESALALLKEGNARWVAGTPRHPHADAARRTETAENGQKPFVTILTCADSRLPAERVFDRGVGDVFVVRVAGNVAGASETGTIEYGVGHLKTPLLVVMGHTRCGAVAAAASDAEVHGQVAGLVERIKPAVERARRHNPQADANALAAAAVRENVWQQIFALFQSSPDLRAAATGGSLTVIGAVYNISTGQVEFLGPHPWQNELVAAINAGRTESPAEAGKPEPVETAAAGDPHGH